MLFVGYYNYRNDKFIITVLQTIVNEGFFIAFIAFGGII